MTTEPTPAPGGHGLRVAVLAARGDSYVAAALPPGPCTTLVEIGTGPGWADPQALAELAHAVDVVHLHARRELLTQADLEPWTEAVRRLGVPLVVTVHDLPGRAASRYARNLAAVLATAELVLTLTPGAAAEISARFGRTPIVVAHPSIAAPVPHRGSERGLVGVVLQPWDPSEDRYLRELVRAALCGTVSGGGRLRVLAEPGPLPPWLAGLVVEERLELVTVRRGAASWPAALQDLHVAVLPERSTTHSSDLEICRDVGTTVVAPRSGRFADQWSEVITYAEDRDALALSLAVTAALTRPAPRPADRTWREEQRIAVHRVYEQVFEQVAGDRLWI